MESCLRNSLFYIQSISRFYFHVYFLKKMLLIAAIEFNSFLKEGTVTNKKEELNMFMEKGYELIENEHIYQYMDRNANAYKTELEKVETIKSFHKNAKLQAEKNYTLIKIINTMTNSSMNWEN